MVVTPLVLIASSYCLAAGHPAAGHRGIARLQPRNDLDLYQRAGRAYGSAYGSRAI